MYILLVFYRCAFPMVDTIETLRRRLTLLRQFLQETVNVEWQRLYLRQIHDAERALEALLTPPSGDQRSVVTLRSTKRRDKPQAAR